MKKVKKIKKSKSVGITIGKAGIAIININHYASWLMGVGGLEARHTADVAWMMRNADEANKNSERLRLYQRKKTYIEFAKGIARMTLMSGPKVKNISISH